MMPLDFHPVGRHFLQIPGLSPVPDRFLRGRKVLADIKTIFRTLDYLAAQPQQLLRAAA